MRKLNLNFSYSFNGKIWNIISDVDGEFLLLEIREHSKFLTTYHLFDLQHNRFILENFSFEETWWIGASSITKDMILFHVYDEQENPDSKDLFAYDWKQQKILWTLDQVNLISVNDDLVYVRHMEEQRDACYHLDTGQTADRYPLQKDSGILQNNLSGGPFHYHEGNPHFKTVQDYIKSQMDRVAVKAADYFENEKVIIISYYYLEANNKLANDLLVVDHEGRILLQAPLGKNLNGIADYTFSVIGEALIFVRDYTDFLVYRFE